MEHYINVQEAVGTGAQRMIVMLLAAILVALSAIGLFLFSQRERHWDFRRCLTAAMTLDRGGSLGPSERTRYNEDC